MRLAFELSGRRRLTWLAMIALVAGASFAWAWGVKSAHSPSSSAAAMIAARFPAEWIAHTPKSAAAFVLARALPQETPTPDNSLDWLSPALLFDPAHQEVTSSLGSGMPVPRFEPNETAAAPAVQAPRVPSRTATLLNDAQIASIKNRLNLSPEQQQLWPPVEAALRGVAWRGVPRQAGQQDGDARPERDREPEDRAHPVHQEAARRAEGRAADDRAFDGPRKAGVATLTAGSRRPGPRI